MGLPNLTLRQVRAIFNGPQDLRMHTQSQAKPAQKPPISRDPLICIIGAGSSGIAAAKVLAQAGIRFDCFEKSDCVGGMWVFKNSNGLSSAYRSLHINTSRDKMAYSDFPMPADFPDYPHHTQIAQYFNAYVDHFGFREHIRFRTGVEEVSRREDGRFDVRLDSGETGVYDAVCVANGHHWDPRFPDPPIPGQFDGLHMHSHHYVDPAEPHDLRGKRIVIVGFGNSALDIACELGRKENCPEVWLSMRRGYWVIPRYFGSKVLDYASPHPSQDPPWLMRALPGWLRAWLIEQRIRAITGLPQEHGLPPPDHPFGASHPAISHEIYNRIGSGDVRIKPDIARFEGKRVHFRDGSQIEADVIIYCTGYHIRFPFFKEGFLSVTNNDIALWKRMIEPRFPNLYFIGLVQPLCAMMPIAEEQAKLMRDHLLGQYLAPSLARMEKERDSMHQAVKARYVPSARHTIQIDCAAYTYDLRRELRKGCKRALAARAGLA